MRTLAIDLGTRRVGLALSDEGGQFATPYEVLEVTSSDQAIDPIVRLINREGLRRVVVGLPLNMDGTVGEAGRLTVSWANRLRNRVPIEVIFVDERLSSFDAEQQLVNRKRQGEKLTRKRKKEQLDAIAAATLLQQYLDGKLPPIAESTLR